MLNRSPRQRQDTRRSRPALGSPALAHSVGSDRCLGGESANADQGAREAGRCRRAVWELTLFADLAVNLNFSKKMVC